MKKFTADYYEKQYRSTFFHKRGENPSTHHFWSRQLRKLKTGGKVLEVGCGEGYFLRKISPHFTTFGIDVNYDGVVNARKRSSSTNFCVADASCLSFKTGTFDIVVAFDLIEHLRQPEDFLREVYRVLISPGFLILRTPNPLSWGAKVKGSAWSGDKDETHINIREPKEWRKNLKENRFELIQEGTGALWDSPYFKFVPSILQKIIFVGSHQLLNYAGFGILPWWQGENWVSISKK